MRNRRTNKTKKNGIAALIFVVFSTVLMGQSANDLAEQYITDYKNNTFNSELFTQLKAQPVQKTMHAFKPYLKDSLADVRAASYRLLYKVAVDNETNQDRAAVVAELVNGLHDSDRSVRTSICNYLTGFKPYDFSAESRYIISRIALEPTTAYALKAVRLTGYLKMAELVYDYNKILSETEGLSRKAAWNMQLAMARMGDSLALASIVNFTVQLPVNDNVVYDIYPDLAYVRQKACFNYLLEQIMSDELNCISSNPDNEAAIVCAFRIIRLIGPYIQNFPLVLDKRGDVVFNNYDTDLATVREWFTTNRNSYTLNHSIY